jgi:MFS family permease
MIQGQCAGIIVRYCAGRYHWKRDERGSLLKFSGSNVRLALFALGATAASGFGQTFFVSLFGGEIRSAFGLSHTAYGSLYSAATISSALLLFKLGVLIDRWSLPNVVALAIAILAGGCLLVGLSPNVALLWLGFACIRLGGQGMMSHIGMTTAARHFSANRGRAVAFAAAGFPLAEAVLPALAALMLVWMNWRLPWVAGAAALCLFVLPVLVGLSWNAPLPGTLPDIKAAAPVPGVDRSRFTRGDVVRDPVFHLILPATLVTPVVVTALFFHQVAFAAERNWSLEALATGFSVYAACHLGALVVAGPLVDRLGAGRALPLTLLPIIAGLLGLALIANVVVVYFYLGLVGMTQGLAATASGVVWAERYGVLHLGAIRSMHQSIMVISTAVSPVLLGVFLDQDVSVAALALAMACLSTAAALLAFLGGARKERRTARAGVRGKG